MKILHTSDWHIGHELHGFDRGPEHDAFLDWLIEQLRTETPDALIVSGDIYDTVNPPVVSQQRLFRFLAAALAGSPHLQVVMVGGNHDSAARIELPRALLDAGRVHLIGGVPRSLGQPDPAKLCVVLRDRSGSHAAVCAAVPYLRPGDIGVGGIKAIYDAAAVAARAEYGDLPLLVTGHLTVSGGEVSTLSERRILVGGEEAVSASIFPTDAQYVALGHLHRPQTISAPIPVRYAGSPFPLSVTEREYVHSISLVDLLAPQDVRIQIIPIPRPVPFWRVPKTGAAPLETIEVLLRELPKADLEPADAGHPFLEVVVELTGPEPDLRRRIEGALEGRAVRLARIERVLPSIAGQAEKMPRHSLGEIDPISVFERFHADTYGTPPSDTLHAAFRALLEEAENPATVQEIVA